MRDEGVDEDGSNESRNLNLFLEFIEKDMKSYQENITPISKTQTDQMLDLIDGVNKDE